jgi:hypothetical protein
MIGFNQLAWEALLPSNEIGEPPISKFLDIDRSGKIEIRVSNPSPQRRIASVTVTTPHSTGVEIRITFLGH